MSATIKPRRGPNLPTTTIDGELLVDTTNKRVYVASGTTGSNANLVAAASHGSTAGLIQFRGTALGQFLSSSLYGVNLSGTTAESVYLGSSTTRIPLIFYSNDTSKVDGISFEASASNIVAPLTTTYNTWSGGIVRHVFPTNLPNITNTPATKTFWAMRASSFNSTTGVLQMDWANACDVCPQPLIIDSETEGGCGSSFCPQGSPYTSGTLLLGYMPTTDDGEDVRLIIRRSPNDELRYDEATNTVITPKVQATDTVESTGLILKTGNTGKVKFVAESFAGAEVTLTVPSTAGGATLISTNSKVGDLANDTWTNISAKISSGKRGTGDVVQAVSPLITTPTIETSLTLSGANPQIKASSTTATCDIFADNTVTAVNLGSLATTVSIGTKTGTVRLVSDTLTMAANIFTIGGLIAPTVDSNKDKGIQFRWHDGTSAKTGFFGFDDSSGKMIFVPDATITSDEVTAGAIGEINAQVHWSNLLAVPSFATSSNNLGYFAATTSSQLAGVISDETGSGSLVFGTSPTFTTSMDSGASFAAFASATSLTLGYSSTAASTTNISTGAVASGNTKTVNIGTSSASGSTTNVNIGSVSGTTHIRTNQLYLGSSSSNIITIDKILPTTGGPTADAFIFGIEIDPTEQYSLLNAYSRLDESNRHYGTVNFGGALFTTYNIAPATEGAGDDDQFVINLGVGTVGASIAEKVINIGTASTSNNTTSIFIGSTSGTSVVTINGDLGVSGGDITTSTTTATLFNSVATTLNIGGAATSITMGATSGTTATIRGGTLVGNTTTQNIFNTTATTINFGGAATAVNIGATGSSTVTIGHNLYVPNKLEATIKSFVIDHPTKQGKKLRYACLEGPENGVYVRGKLDGENTIVLPEYWVNLVDEETITVNLTGIDSSGYHTVKKIENNKITVQSSSGNVNCYYVVYGERKDVSKLVTEFE